MNTLGSDVASQDVPKRAHLVRTLTAWPTKGYAGPGRGGPGRIRPARQFRNARAGLGALSQAHT